MVQRQDPGRYRSRRTTRRGRGYSAHRPKRLHAGVSGKRTRHHVNCVNCETSEIHFRLWHQTTGYIRQSPSDSHTGRNRRSIVLPDHQSFSVQQLSQLLSINRAEVSRLIEEGAFSLAYDLRSPGASRSCLRVPRQAVLEFLENGQISTSTKKPCV